jgi:hypothetical protein
VARRVGGDTRFRWGIRPGDIVLARFGELPDRVVVKRAVRQVGPDRWWVEGDNSFCSDDSRRYGPAEVFAVVLWRYWPLVRRPFR